MNERWQYKVVDVAVKMLGDSVSVRAQAELDRLGAQGWQLVSVVQSPATCSLSMFLRKGP